MQLILIRHGQTEGNRAGRYIGATDEPLSAEGRAALQRQRAAGRYPAVSLVFTSPLLRCRQSAACIYPNLQAQAVPGLQECHFGAFEGLCYEELQGRADYRRWLEGGPCPGGESRGEFIQRCAEAFLPLVQGLEGNQQQAALVLHGGVIMALLHRFAQPAHSFYHWQLPCGAGYRAAWSEGRLRQVCRLEGLG